MINLVQSERILCVDPGTTHSGVVEFDGVNIIPVSAKYDNEELVQLLRNVGPRGNGYLKHMAIEMIASYGMAVGESTFETVRWIGRLQEAFNEPDTTLVYRKNVKMFLCNSMRAKDANIRRAILDLFPATGGGKTPQIGTKSQPGPLFGVTSHMMSALAVGLWYHYAPRNVTQNSLETP